MTPTTSVTSPDGTTLAVFESGPPAGPIIVAVHGYPDHHVVWDGLVAELIDRFRVVTYDVRGAGASATPATRAGYRIPRLIDDLVAVLDAVAPGRAVHLVAHDWGSVQVWPALTDPRLDGRVASFTSMSGPSLDHTAVWAREARRHPGAAARQAGRSYYTALFQVPALPELAARAGFMRRAITASNRRTRSVAATGEEPARLTKDAVNGLNLYRANLAGRFARPRPETVDIPVLVLAPAADAYITSELATQAPAPFVPNLRTQVVPGGHWVLALRPDVVAGRVRDFIEHVDGAAESRPLARSRRHTAGAFNGQLVLVTGGGRGIGRATALEFARAGADVIVADINDLAAKETVHELTALGVQAAAYHLDVADTAAWEQFADQVRAEHGVPDVIVNNAGIGMGGAFLQTSVADWDRILGINLWGVIHGSRIFGTQLVERGQGGHIVNIASAAAFTPSKSYPAYATTKAAVLMLTECLRAELAREGIGVTAICPGFVDSDIATATVYVGVDEQTQHGLREHAAASYRRRNYTPERVARHIVRAAANNTPVAAISAESKAFRALTRVAPPMARKLAEVDLTRL